MTRINLLSLVALAAVTLLASSANAAPPSLNILTPVTGTWVATGAPGQPGLSMTFYSGEGYNDLGNPYGQGIGNGAPFKYAYKITGPASGRMTLIAPNGQTDVFITFQNSGKRMVWQFGGQSVVFTKLN